MSYWRTYYHLIWTTKNREALITPERMEMLQRAIRVVAKDHGAFTHAIGGMPDHLHVAISIPPKFAVANFVHAAKGSSSRFLNKSATNQSLEQFAWQSEYRVMTFGEGSLQRVVSYIGHQVDHHANDDIWIALEQLPSLDSTKTRH